MAHLNQQSNQKRKPKNKTSYKRSKKRYKTPKVKQYNYTKLNKKAHKGNIWSKFKHWWSNQNILFQVLMIVCIFFTCCSIIGGYVNAKMNAINYKTEEKASRYEPQSNYLVKQGGIKYLKEQLNISSTKELKEKINDTAKYHGQYDYIIQQAKQCTTNADLWKTLNPVVDAVQSGARYRPNQKVKPDFKIYNSSDIPNVEYNNLLVVSYNSKDDNQTKIINQYIEKNPDIKVLVFDTSTDGGKQAFEVPMYNFLNNGGQMIDGYSISKNAWMGVAYGFVDDNLTYHTKNLNDLNNLKNLPDKSLADDNIKNQNDEPTLHDYE